MPFAPESALSGVQRKITQNDKLWYKRTFTVPSGWSGRRVQLNFGASYWGTTVWANGKRAGAVHHGGYDAFSYDITPLLNGGSNTLVVSAYDPTETGGQALGKQRIQDVTPHAGKSIVYTASSGIWQTVWLEPTAIAHITRLDMVPRLEDNTLRVTVRGAGADGARVKVTVPSGGTTVDDDLGERRLPGRPPLERQGFLRAPSPASAISMLMPVYRADSRDHRPGPGPVSARGVRRGTPGRR